jgi:biotin-dependent carboxylase-like uncharacterized protein
VSVLRVIDAGVATTVQDAGRPGFAHLGVPASGVVDGELAALVNRLVGNEAGSAVIETTGALVLRAERPALVASSVEGVARSLGEGAELRVPSGHGRVWHYVAVRGGIAVEPVLGSRSTDTLAGIGPRPLHAGDLIPVGPDPGTDIDPGHAPLRPLASIVRLSVGPRADWFEPGALDRLVATGWTVTVTSRIGVRMTGEPLRRSVTRELPSEGLVRGAIQVPPDGDPVMMLADHPTTGGYPVIAVVHPDDVAVVAQTSAGRPVRFRM